MLNEKTYIVISLTNFIYNAGKFLSMSDGTVKALGAYKLLADKTNRRILRLIDTEAIKAKDLERHLDLDRMSIKRRLYAMHKVGLVIETEVPAKRTKAKVYKTKDVKLPSLSVRQILKQVQP